MVVAHWRNIFLVGLFFSVINGLFAAILFYNTLSSENFMPFLLIYMAGDLIGLLVMLVTIMFGARIASTTSG